MVRAINIVDGCGISNNVCLVLAKEEKGDIVLVTQFIIGGFQGFYITSKMNHFSYKGE